jgi:signal transduction histidine kinase
MEDLSELTNNLKQRHGCVTAWLIFMIIANSLTSIIYLFAGDMIAQNFQGGISNSMLILLAILGVGNVIFSILLFKWMIIGFWGFFATSIAALVVNLSMGLGIVQSLFGLVGIAVLYGVLQIKKDNVSAWTILENQSKQTKYNINSDYKSAKTIRKEKLEEEEKLKQQAAEEAERIRRRKEKEDPHRFMPK